MGGFSSPSDHTTPPNIFNHFSYHFPVFSHVYNSVSALVHTYNSKRGLEPRHQTETCCGFTGIIF